VSDPPGRRSAPPRPVRGSPSAVDVVLGAVAAGLPRPGRPAKHASSRRAVRCRPGSSWPGPRRPCPGYRCCRGHSPSQRLWGGVDQLDLVGGAHDRVRYGLPLRHAGDVFDHVVEGFQVCTLTVVITLMPASSKASTSCQRFSYRPPGMLVWASSSTSATSAAEPAARPDPSR